MRRKNNRSQVEKNEKLVLLKTKYCKLAEYTRLLGFLFFWLTITPSFGQTDSLNRISRQFGQYQQHHLQEKLFMHLDRPLYVGGETMWFKIYTVDGATNKPLHLSKVAYVEVTDKENQWVLQAKIALQDGAGHGSLVVPVTLNSGNYTVRAYTNWMKNNSPEFYFQQPITIVNTRRPLDNKPGKDSVVYAAQFFPEGGHLVQGLKSKVAFKITDNSGKGVDAAGEVTDANGNTVAQFQTLKFGMGNFSFTPAGPEPYRALIRLPNGQTLTRNLPPAQAQGYVMHLDDSSPENIKIAVHSSLTSGSPAELLYLLAHTRGSNAIAKSEILAQGQVSFTLAKNALAEGISHLTIFNSRKQPVCERLYFKQPTQKLTIQAKPDKNQYATRQKVNLDLTASSTSGTATPANLSMAVYRLDSLQTPPGTDIRSYLWLTSDLIGNIENPAFYFQEGNILAHEALDNLLLTQGWRRFRWPEIFAKSQPVPEFIPEVNGPLIRGKVTERATGAPAPNITTYLAAPGKHIRLYNATSNAGGFIQFEAKDFYGPKEIVVQSNFSKDSLYHFEIFSPFSPKYAARLLPTLRLTEQQRPEIALRHLQMEVQEAYYDKFQRLVKLPTVDSLAFYGTPDEKYLLDNFTRFKVMEEVMREYVPGVMVRIRKGGFHFLTLDRINKTFFQQNPMVLLDGVPVFDINKIMAFDPLKIHKLEVITSRYFHGPQLYEGLVSYTTYDGDLAGFPLDARALLQEYEGLQIPREFYAPVYDTSQQQQSRLPDLRNLLYWAPQLKIGANGKQPVGFYTSDQDGDYLVVIQGLSQEGQAGSVLIPLSVKRSL
ncbi:hypothetical protein AAE02nite_51070 [Adhaeribacter aerolatus]|uniref:Macroglobulin domain-containing protein n=1 Tax=Adhaeribacter aerolatus TaxID=670289 RepID=A0A512B654_9BACT|nr:hypothetical protein [Adhaeribacter aerolatus]GEO07443.1 hypothetical protein AAE02nite_51070 [Adhaeribacter aerolatus]